MSIDALRLAGRLKDRTGPVTLERITQICDRNYEDRSVPEIIAELEAVGYLRDYGPDSWVRTKLPYNASASRALKQAVQKMKRIHTEHTQVSVVRDDVDDGVAHWFGYCKHPVFVTGRVHRLEDDE